jgi:hypothetical protein
MPLQRFRFFPALCALLLSACGGGGSSPVPQSVAVKTNTSSPASVSANPGALPSSSPNGSPASVSAAVAITVQADLSAAVSTESAAQSYLPFYAGNYWSFSNGAKITDMGSVSLACSCAINGISAERFDIAGYANFSVSMYYAKGSWSFADAFSGHRITYYIGYGALGGNTIDHALFYSNDGAIPGVPQIDDTPTTGEQFTLTAALGSTSYYFPIVSAILSTGNTQTIGSQSVQNVANTIINVPGGGGQDDTRFAPGIGFTHFWFEGPDPVTSFSVSPNSHG